MTLLSKKLQRQLELLEILFEGETYRFSDLEELLNCSSKTLRTDLSEINSYAKGIDIQADRETGVSAVISSYITKDYIYRIIMEESLEFHYLESILLRKYDHYFTLADELFVSESTLRRIADKVKPTLKKYHLEIQGLIKVSGDHQIITELTIQLLSEKYHYFENAFSLEFCQTVRQLVDEFLAENNLEEKAATLDTKEQQNFYFLVASRIFQVENATQPVQNISVKQNFRFNKILARSFKLPITKRRLSEEMLNYIFTPTMINSVLGVSDPEVLSENSHKIISHIDSYTCQLERKYQISNEDKEKIRQKIIYYLNCPNIPRYLLYDRNRSILKYIQSELKTMEVNLKNSLKLLEREGSINIPDVESFVQYCVSEIILNWPALLKKIEQSRRVKALVVTSDTGSYAKYMIKKLEYHLGNRYHFAASTTPSLTTEMLHKEKFDCIISTITLAASFSIPIFGISFSPSTRELYNLFEFYQHFGL